MTREEKDACVGRLVKKRQSLKEEIACLGSQLTDWETNLNKLALFLKVAREGGRVMASQDQDLDAQAFVIPGEGRIVSLPVFDEVAKALTDLEQAREDLKTATAQLKDCGID